MKRFELADLRHFARAADRCNLSQPAVSHQIRLLEEDLGARLLNRAGRQVSLTVAGELLLEDTRRILAAIDRARERVRGVSSGALGRVRLGATQTVGLYMLPAVLDRYRAEHPAFALSFTIGTELELLERVAANDLDMAVMAGRPVLGELRRRRIGKDDLVVIAGPASPFARRRAVKPSDLRGEPWIVREHGSDTRRELDAWLRRHRGAPAHLLTLPSSDAVKQAVIAGLGLGLVSRLVVAEDLRARRLVEVALRQPIPSRDVLLVDHPQKHHGAACQAMVKLTAEALQAMSGSA